ncbi:4Fe-4S ferredoxin iron-sulfur binding domain-containing protein [Nostoc commune NIES-4072]|uniref:4Fe-4S ferredoxin iron-sulfur binding domain-containing protein n=1 Tax=Nostoc commune NIES-4072 TaxID=2005467 RepID=A0A2R5G339_NOSCO|nr:4Fe-4S binding protein [Nostoc commune]BBD66538.1 4Fe-4S ferredoxin iron-sulfur binding domain-containing protein [Nostoc commune HK-02]GBG22481.1 4Fe-4S ferredoxin iron-sulfur binding domain-containing protein [Nostoc commune NIES-4072]
MAYKILTSQCISCNLCLTACPTNAVKLVDGQHWIDPELCTNCIGSIHTVPQCKAGCPTCDGCVKQPSDYWEGWFANYNRVVAKLTNKQDYWERWFNCYSQKYSEQLQKRQSQSVGSEA